MNGGTEVKMRWWMVAVLGVGVLALAVLWRGGERPESGGGEGASRPGMRLKAGPSGRVADTTEGVPSKAGARPPRRERGGVITTASGLQYSVLREGSGERPGPTDRVRVRYVGTTLDGRRFDGTEESGEARTFPLNGVIKGWGEGLQLMKEGARYRFVIPPELAYGERGAPGRIGPNETLVFEVELLAVEAAAPRK